MKLEFVPKNEGGFSLVELGIVAVVIGILMAVLLDRLAFYSQQAEVIMYKTVLVNMRTGLRVHVMQLSNAGKSSEVALLDGANAVEFLARPPANYLGELGPVNEEELPRGHWYYRKSDRYLRYLLNSGGFVANEGQKYLNFKVKLLHLSKNSPCQLKEISSCRAVLEQVD